MTLVVAFDIETLGLLPTDPAAPLPPITCVCMHTSDDEDVCVRLWGEDLSEDDRAAGVRRVLALLDDADVLVGYNAAPFDLEFIRRALLPRNEAADARMLAWVLKCIDPLMLARHVAGQGSRMQDMLVLNGLGSKTASGGEAIEMARAGEWDALLKYCLMDARLVYELVMLPRLQLTPSVACELSPVLRFFRTIATTTAAKMEEEPMLPWSPTPMIRAEN